MVPTPDMIAAAWAAWRVRHPTLRLGPGPGFREAVAAAIAAAPSALLWEALQERDAPLPPLVRLPVTLAPSPSFQGRGVPDPARDPEAIRAPTGPDTP